MKGLTLEKIHVCQILLLKHLTDFIVITETWQRQNYVLYAPLVVAKSTHTPNNRTGGLVILTRLGLKDEFHILDVTTHSITFRYKNYDFHALYLPPSMPWETCRQFLPKTKVSVLLGDINCNISRRQKNTLLTNRRDEFLAICTKYQLEWKTASPEFRNDHVLSQPHIQPEIDIRPPIHPKTDHTLIHIILPNRAPPPPSTTNTAQTIRYNLKYLDNPHTSQSLQYIFSVLWNDNQPLFHNLQQHILSQTDPHTTQPLIDTFYNIYTSLLNTCCETILGTYIVQEQTQAIDHSIDFLRNSTAHHHAVRLFKRSQRGKQKSMASDNPPLSPLADATTFYERLYNPNTTQQLQSRYYHRQSPRSFSNVLLDICSISNIRKQILKYPSSKSFGLDILHIRIFKALSPSTPFMESLHMLFQLCLSTTLTPTHWNTSQITPIPKKSTSFTPSTSRPISLTPCLRRVFESLILQFIYSDKALNEFSPYQAGFRPGYNTITQLWLTQASVYHPTDPRSIHIFLDLEKAYDRVPIPRLLDKLKLRNTPTPLIQIVDSLFSQCYSQLIVNAAIGPTFRRSVGLFQGSILSPWLFNVYIDDLATKIARIDPNPTIPPLLLFADDIKLQPSTINIAHRMLAITTTWSVHNGININVNKSGVITNDTTSSLTLSINNQPLPQVHEYEYLGLPFTANGIDFKKYVHSLTKKTERLFFASTHHSRGWSPFIRLILFKTFLRPTYEYALPILAGSQTPLTPLVKLQDMLCHWIVNGYRGSVTAHALSGISPINLRVQELTMRFHSKLHYTHPDNPIRPLIHDLKSRKLSPTARKRLLAHLYTPNTMYQEYLAISDNIPPWEEQYTFTKHIQTNKLKYFRSLSNVLPKNILDFARDQSLVDISLRIKSPPIRSYALRWRINRLLHSYKCHCSGPLNRGHLDTCFNLETHPLYSTLCSRYPFPNPKPTTHYNLIDHALNIGSVHAFLRLLHFVTSNDDFVFDPP